MDQIIQIENDKRQKLIGVLHDCKSDTLVIFCHGYTASKDMEGFVYLSQSLNANGVSTFRFDFSDKQLSLKQEVTDLETVIGHLNTYKHVYLLGHSLGVLPALVCINAKSVTGIISVNGFFQGKVYRNDFNRAYQTLKLLRFVVPRIWSEWEYMKKHINPEKITKPMLLITTEHDEVLDYHQSITFGGQLKHAHMIEILALSDHGIGTKNDGEVIAQTVMKWIKQA